MCAVDASIVHGHDTNTVYITTTASLVSNLCFSEDLDLPENTGAVPIDTYHANHPPLAEEFRLCDIFDLLQK